MGMANYLARFMPHLTDTIQCLRNLLKNDVPYVWSKTKQTSFDAVKVMLEEAPILAFYNSDKELLLENDASEYGLGSVLTQDDKPVAYASRYLSSAERQLRSDRERNAERVVWFEQVSPLYLRSRCHCGD